MLPCQICEYYEKCKKMKEPVNECNNYFSKFKLLKIKKGLVIE